MGIAEKYIEYAQNVAKSDPEKGWNRILLGFQANCLRTSFLPNKKVAKGFQKLEDMMMKLVANSLSHEGSYVWGNIFAPCELLESMGYRMLSVEILGCFLSGYHLEEFFIDHAQSLGMAPTLCSYHKNFIGAVTSGVVPAPVFSLTTSLSCDGNLNTFRYLQKKTDVPFFLLDIPYQDDEASIAYVAEQFKDMVHKMETELGCRCDEVKLREALRIENETRKELMRFYQLQQEHYYPSEIIHQLYLTMGVHLMMGTREFLELIRFMNKDIQNYPRFTGKRILWVHLLPLYQKSLEEYFNCNEKYQLLLSDLIMDYTETLDAAKPYESLAAKLIRNVFNGTYNHKAELVSRMAEKVKADAVIHFCHWGCKQADGGSVILKEEMQKQDIPMLILDGDGIDSRNSHEGQIKTRLEAFLEMIEEVPA